MADRIVVIGGNAAGMTAASRARRLDPTLEITLVELSHFISYSICGLPFYIAGEVPDHERLITFTPERLLEERGIRALLRVVAEEIQPGRRKILCREVDSGREFELGYDQVVIATGYTPRVPAIAGLDLERVLTVSRLENGIRIRHLIQQAGVRRVAIIGAGYIGLMMAGALRSRGLEIVLLEQNKQVLPSLDPDMAEHLEKELRQQGVELLLGARVRRLRGRDGVLEGVEVGGEVHPVDLALIDVGVEPNVELALRSGLAQGVSGGIQVDARGQTSQAGIWAAGNCAEVRHLVSGRPVTSTLGTAAARQGRVVGENLAGHRTRFEGTLETSVEKVFDLSVGRTGLTLRRALAEGFEARSVQITARDRAGYYAGNRPLHVKLVFETTRGRLLGGQLIGEDGAAKRIDTLVAALTARLTLAQVAQLDLAYAPPFGTLWDPIQIAANVALRRFF